MSDLESGQRIQARWAIAQARWESITATVPPPQTIMHGRREKSRKNSRIDPYFGVLAAIALNRRA
ncbi:MAG TPA: hypothetical protein PLR41_00125 [Alphaproteobacteria bacterium]|nr:hypothetical protein [Alphaproteobacteria bacterium]